MGANDSLPDDVNTLKAMLRAERAARLAAEAEAQARTLLIEKLKLTIKKLRHEQFGQSSERGALLDQLELQLADLEENAAHAETAAQLAAAETITVPAFEYAGFTKLYQANRKPGPIVEAACWAHGRRKFFDLARLSKAPIAAEAVKRIDALFAIEREINGLMPEERLRVRQERSRSLIIELQTWLREQRARLSKNSDTTKAINYSLNRWDAFTRFLDDGRLCISNNAAERELRAVALGRKNWTFAGSDEGGRRAAAIYTLIATAKLNDVDPQTWLADVLARLPDHPAKRIHELLPWNWRPRNVAAEAA